MVEIFSAHSMTNGPPATDWDKMQYNKLKTDETDAFQVGGGSLYLISEALFTLLVPQVMNEMAGVFTCGACSFSSFWSAAGTSC